MDPDDRSAHDRELVRRVAVGDPAAFERIFRTHYAALCRFVNSRLGSPEEAEELVQTLFTRLWDRRERWEVRESLAAYLYRAARNEIANQLKRRRRERLWRQAALQEVAADPPFAPAADRGAEEEEIAARVRAAIDRLPPRARQVVELRWRHGLRYAEIAEITGISVKAVEVQLARAMKALRELLAS